MPKIIKTSGITPVLDKESIEALVAEYASLREQESKIKSRKEQLAKDIKEYALAYGTKSNTGSCYCDSEKFTYGAQAKTSVSFNQEDAVKFLEDRGFDSAVKTLKQVDEDRVNDLVEQGKITIEDLRGITTSKTTYSIDVKVKKEVESVAEEVPVAASKKSASLSKKLAKRR